MLKGRLRDAGTNDDADEEDVDDEDEEEEEEEEGGVGMRGNGPKSARFAISVYGVDIHLPISPPLRTPLRGPFDICNDEAEAAEKFDNAM